MTKSSKHGGGVTQRLCTHTATTNNARVYAHIYTPGTRRQQRAKHKNTRAAEAAAGPCITVHFINVTYICLNKLVA